MGFRNHNDQLKNLLPIRGGNSVEEDQDDNNTLPAAALSLLSSIFMSQNRVEKRPEKDLKGTPILDLSTKEVIVSNDLTKIFLYAPKNLYGQFDDTKQEAKNKSNC